ncbi:GATA zinc finger domain-containing protein 14-like isoform X2 [Daktulosphaira vitifoliae]|nr:GATA zinc finger domain-containing protein 14-like isoform X2 [Daktulosphaira vitifoliae]
MDLSENDIVEDDVERKYRTVWVGNLHPKVTEDIVAELFFQMGPIECVQFGYDDYNRYENFAWVTFKYENSVYDCMKIFQGTKLYGLTIKMKNYLDNPEEQRFDEELDNFKELIRVECGNYNSNKQNIYNYERNIPDSLPQPPMHSSNYNFDSNIKHKFEPYSESNSVHHASNSGKHNQTSQQHSNRKQFLKLERFPNSFETSKNDWVHCNREYSNKFSENYQSMSSNKNKNRFYNQEHFSDNHNLNKHIVPVRDLRDTMYHKRSPTSNDIQNDSNAACTSSLDLRDIINPSSSSSNKDRRYDNPNSYGNWHDRHRNNTEQNYSTYLERKLQNKHFESNRFNKHDINYQNYTNSQEHHDRQFTDDQPFNNFNDRHLYPNNYHNNDYNQKDSRPNSYGYNSQRSSRNSGNRQQSHHPYKRNGDQERKGRVINNDQYSYSHNSNTGGYNKPRGSY